MKGTVRLRWLPDPNLSLLPYIQWYDWSILLIYQIHVKTLPWPFIPGRNKPFNMAAANPYLIPENYLRDSFSFLKRHLYIITCKVNPFNIFLSTPKKSMQIKTDKRTLSVYTADPLEKQMIQFHPFCFKFYENHITVFQSTFSWMMKT